MLLSALMNGVTPSATYSGAVTAEDMVLAVDCTASGNATSPAGYAVVQLGVEGVDAKLSAESKDKQYLRTGKSTTKTGTQRTFSVSGDRYVGDDFQDFVLSHAIAYGVGNAVVRPYVYFNMLTGKGEQGYVSIIVESNGGGNAGDSSTFSVNLNTTASKPTEYTWVAPTTGGNG